MKKCILIFVCVFLFISNVNALCTDKEIVTWAKDLELKFVPFNYSEHSNLDMQKYRYAYFFALSKNREDVSFRVKDQLGNSIDASMYQEINLYGVGCYNGVDAENYLIEVYGNDKSKCPGEIITTFKYRVGKYNEYSKSSYCEENPDHELCARFTDSVENMTFSDFERQMISDKGEEIQKDSRSLKIIRIIMFILPYLLCAIVPPIIISIYYRNKLKTYIKLKNQREFNGRGFIILLALLLLPFNKLDAALTCGDTTIIETPNVSSNWDVNMVTCNWFDTGVSEEPVDTLSYSQTEYLGEMYWVRNLYDQEMHEASEIDIPWCRTDNKIGPSGHVGQIDGVTHHNYVTTCCVAYDSEGNCSSYQTISGTCTYRTYENIHSDMPPGPACGECVPCSCNSDEPVLHYVNVCPHWGCNATRQRVPGFCIHTFYSKTDDMTAFCVNPSYGFPGNVEMNYQRQPLDATKCISSNSTVDCGFANILIESMYHDFRDQVTSLALRMWGGRTNQGGYDKSGLAMPFQGYQCNYPYEFPKYKYPYSNSSSVYKETMGFVFATYFEALSQYEIYKVSDLVGFLKKLACENGPYAVSCTGNFNDNSYFTGGGSTERFAMTQGLGGEITYDELDEFDVERFANRGGTIEVSADYINAWALILNTIFGNRDMQDHLREMFGERSTDPVAASVDSYVVDDFSMIAVQYREDITGDQKSYCEDIRVKYNSGEYLDMDERRLLDFCNNEIKYVIGKRGSSFVDFASGQVVSDLNGDNRIDDYDLSVIPLTKTYKFEYCQKDTCYAKVDYFATCNDGTDVEEKYDLVYAVIEYNESKSSGAIRKYFACGPGDLQTMYAYSKTGDKSDRLTQIVEIDLMCNTTRNCNNYEIRKHNECGTEAGGYSHDYIRDPSLNCIINMQNTTSRRSYDYSDFFGVNSNFCKIYCSDAVEYYTADKFDLYSGLSFKLDIEYKLFEENKSPTPFSSIVLMKRTCASKIFYDDNKFEDYIDFEHMYDHISAEQAKNIHSWKDLYETIKPYGDSVAHIREIKYDLYNCNLYSEIPVPKPKNNRIGNVYSRIKELYSKENDYGFNGDAFGYNRGVRFNEEENTVIDANIAYSGGAYYVGPDRRVGSKLDDIKIGYEINNHTGYKNGNVSDVTYCTGKDCFKYYPTGEDEYLLPDQLKSNKNRVISTEQGDDIPTNDYAYFTIVNEVDFYNDSKFQIEPYTGDVADVTGISEELYDEDYLDLQKYVYPVSTDANVECRIKKNGNSYEDKCNILHEFRIDNTYYRKLGRGTNDYVNAIKTYDHSCNIDYLQPPTSLEDEIIIRNTDLSNIFPSIIGDDNRRVAINWMNSEKYINSIESYIKTHGEYQYYESHEEYSYTFTQSSLQKIRDYNNSVVVGKSYLDNSIEKGSCTITDGNIALGCKSSFITKMQEEELEVVNNRSDKARGVSDYTLNKTMEEGVNGNE